MPPTTRRILFWMRTHPRPAILAGWLLACLVALPIAAGYWTITRDQLEISEKRRLHEQISILTGDDLNARLKAAKSLGYMGQAALPAVPDIVRVAYTGSENVYSALGYICQGGGCPPDAIDVLVRAADAGNGTATHSLKLIGHPRALDFAIANLKLDSRQGGRAYAVGKYKSERAIAALIQHERNMKKNMMWLGQGCRAIADMGEFAAEPFAKMMIRNEYGDFDDQARDCIMYMMRHEHYEFLRTEPLREYARRVLKFKLPEVVQIGIWIARAQSHVFELGSLRRISADESFEFKLRQSAAHALIDGDRGAPLAVTREQHEELLEIIADTTSLSDLRQNAIKCLGATRDPRMVARLLSLDSWDADKGTIVQSLVWIGAEDAVLELRGLVNGPEFDDRLRQFADAEIAKKEEAARMAFEAIGQINGTSRYGQFGSLIRYGEFARPYLITLVNEPDRGSEVIKKLAEMDYNDSEFLTALAGVVAWGYDSPRWQALTLIERYDDKRFIASLIELIRQEQNAWPGREPDYASIRAAILLLQWSGENYMLNSERWNQWWARNQHRFPDQIQLPEPLHTN